MGAKRPGGLVPGPAAGGGDGSAPQIGAQLEELTRAVKALRPRGWWEELGLFVAKATAGVLVASWVLGWMASATLRSFLGTTP